MLLNIWDFSLTKGLRWSLAHVLEPSGPTMRSLANFDIELEQFCCSLWPANACMCKIMLDKISRYGKIRISLQDVLCMRTSKFLHVRELYEFNFCGSISVFGHVCVGLGKPFFGSRQPARLFWGGRKLRVFFERAIVDQFWPSTAPALRVLSVTLFLAPARPFRRPWADGNPRKRVPLQNLVVRGL